jgi:hypothetical protein
VARRLAADLRQAAFLDHCAVPELGLVSQVWILAFSSTDTYLTAAGVRFFTQNRITMLQIR